MSRRTYADRLGHLAARRRRRPASGPRGWRALWEVLTAGRTLPDGCQSWALVDGGPLGRPATGAALPATAVTVAMRPADPLAEHPLPSTCLLVAEPSGDPDGGEGAASRSGDLIVVGVVEWAALDLTGVDLRGLVLEEVDLRGATLVRADLRGADVFGADMRGADLREADLRQAALTGVDLSEADLSLADLRRATLGGDLSAAQLTGADLRKADLIGACLSRAVLWDADLAGADLAGADLQGANLQGANLRGATLGCDLRMASLEGANFTGTDPWSCELEFASSDGTTTWPAGFDPEAEEILVADGAPHDPVQHQRGRASRIRSAAAPGAGRPRRSGSVARSTRPVGGRR